MQDFLYLAIFVGLMVNLVVVDMTGVILGGFFVPGYLALQITDPVAVLQIVGGALVTVGIVRALGNFMILYGRKMMVVSILVGFLLSLCMAYFGRTAAGAGYKVDFGLIVPGLMAYWMQRQGILETLMLGLIGAVIVRLILVLITGGMVSL